jgi:hypothetical protein
MKNEARERTGENEMLPNSRPGTCFSFWGLFGMKKKPKKEKVVKEKKVKTKK